MEKEQKKEFTKNKKEIQNQGEDDEFTELLHGPDLDSHCKPLEKFSSRLLCQSPYQAVTWKQKDIHNKVGIFTYIFYKGVGITGTFPEVVCLFEK